MYDLVFPSDINTNVFFYHMILRQNDHIKMVRRAVKIFFRFVIISLCSTFLILVIYSPLLQHHNAPMHPGSTLHTQRGVMVQGWEEHVSRDTRQYVLPESFTTVINIDNLCTMDLFLIVIVCSTPVNFEQRSVIRETWASLADNATTVVFMLGESDDISLQTQIQEESETYNDIIQEAFLDSYNNLTIKSVMMLKWVNQHCSSAQFLMKCDDDVYLNLPALSKALRKIVTKRKNILIGSLITKAKPIQDPNDKSYTPQYIFNEPYFPNYLSGTGYVLSLDVVPKLYKAALNIPIVHLEDVYITGICACLAGVKPLNHYGFFYQRQKLSNSCSPKVITNHHLSPADLRTAFSHVNNCTE